MGKSSLKLILHINSKGRVDRASTKRKLTFSICQSRGESIYLSVYLSILCRVEIKIWQISNSSSRNELNWDFSREKSKLLYVPVGWILNLATEYRSQFRFLTGKNPNPDHHSYGFVFSKIKSDPQCEIGAILSLSLALSLSLSLCLCPPSPPPNPTFSCLSPFQSPLLFHRHQLVIIMFFGKSCIQG